MKNFKNQKGITLVALVVTIIVLLILAGVSISLVAGNDGLLKKATNAADTNNEAAAREGVLMWIADQQAAFYQAAYAEQSVSTNVKVGDWIVLTANKGAIKEEDGYTVKTAPQKTKFSTSDGYNFTIDPESKLDVDTDMSKLEKTEYVIKIEQNKTIPYDITGKLYQDGTVEWDEVAAKGNV